MKIWINEARTQASRILPNGEELAISVKEALLLLKTGRGVRA